MATAASVARAPRWPLAVALLLGLTQPLVHLWLAHCPPPGAESSGLSIPDSAIFLQSMRMFQEGFASPYALCDSAWGDASFRYFAVPHLWLYGVLGLLANLLHVPHFLFLGIVNGVCLTLYLLAIWRFLRVVTPGLAAHAFALFTLSSGPGGLLWLLTGVLGLHDAAGFDAWFFRFAVYDLMEGPHFHPLLIAPRCYYTLPLAVYFGALTTLKLSLSGSKTRLWWWMLPIALAAFVYARAGLFSVGLCALLLFTGEYETTFRRRALQLAAYALPVVIGMTLSGLLLRMNPAVVQNHVDYTNVAMWISPALVALSLHLPWVAQAIQCSWTTLRPLERRIAGAALGYFVAYCLLYLARSLYYGTLVQGLDGSVAAAVSDYALAGVPVGAWLARGGGNLYASRSREAPAWALFTLLLFGTLALSGFAGGAFLAAGPQRLQLFLWLPVCVLTAAALSTCTPATKRLLWALFCISGGASLLVALVIFQAGAGRVGAQGPFPRAHAAWLPAGTHDALAPARGQMLLALPPLSDAAVRNVGAKTPFGIASFNLSDRTYQELEATTRQFFAPGATELERKKLVGEWCVDWVAAPIGESSQDIAIKELNSYKWLRAEPISGPVALWGVLLRTPD